MTRLADLPLGTGTILSILQLLTFGGSARAEICHVLQTSTTVINTVPARPMPQYMVPVKDPSFQGKITRIAGNTGTSCAQPDPAGCLWAGIVRHHYSKDQPWNADGTLLAIHQTGASGPSNANWLLLDGNTYQVLQYGHMPTNTSVNLNAYDDWRWHPTLPNVQIAIRGNVALGDANTLYWVDATSGTRLQSWSFGGHLEISTSDRIGQAEGNVSNNGRYIAISTTATPARVFVLDMVTGEMGPVHIIEPCDILNNSTDCTIGWISISPDAKFVVVKYGGSGDEMIRVFDVDLNPGPSYLTISLRTIPNNPLCGLHTNLTPLLGSEGWVGPLKHPDMTMDGSTAVLVGINKCSSTIIEAPGNWGRILRVNLTDGAKTKLSPPGASPTNPYGNEAPAMHCSCRNYDRPGWCYVTYEKPSTASHNRLQAEIVAVKIDGTASQRFTHTHATTPATCGDNGYECEPQAVPSRDGARVLWASNWSDDFTGPVNPNEPKAFVIDARPGTPARTTDLTVGTLYEAVQLTWTAPGDDGSLFQAASYEVRCSANPITEANFASAPLIGGVPAPQPAGATEQLVVPIGCGGHYFALKTHGTCGTVSAMSNASHGTLECDGGPYETDARGHAARGEVDLPLALDWLGPNPSTGAGAASWSIPQTKAGGPYELAVFDVAGRKLWTIAEGTAQAGRFSQAFGPGAAGFARSGVIFLRLSVRGEVISRPVIVVQ
jgi:hypothetical protein